METVYSLNPYCKGKFYLENLQIDHSFDFCIEDVKGWFFRKEVTLGCFQALEQKRNVLEQISVGLEIPFKVDLSIEMKSILLEAKLNNIWVTIALHMPADCYLPANSKQGFDYDKICGLLNDNAIAAEKIRFKRNQHKGCINPYSLLSDRKCIQIFDIDYLNKRKWTYVTTNAGDREWGILFCIQSLFKLMEKNGVVYFFIPIAISSEAYLETTAFVDVSANRLLQL